MIKQLPLSVQMRRKTDVRTQFGALCYRVKNNKTQVLLITSRNTGRWIVPKGWPMEGLTPAKAARQEAWEEAGVVGGRSIDTCLGLFSYRKQFDKQEDLPCVVMVYPVKVKRLEKDYPEKDERSRKWFSRKKAAKLVREPELAGILRSFDPKYLSKFRDGADISA